MAMPTQATFDEIQQMRDGLGRGEILQKKVSTSGFNVFSAALTTLRKEDEGWYKYKLRKERLALHEQEEVVTRGQKSILLYTIWLEDSDTAVSGPRARELQRAEGFENGRRVQGVQVSWESYCKDTLEAEIETYVCGLEYDWLYFQDAASLKAQMERGVDALALLRKRMQDAGLDDEAIEARFAQLVLDKQNETLVREIGRRKIRASIEFKRTCDSIHSPILQVPDTWLRFYTVDEIDMIWNPGEAALRKVFPSMSAFHAERVKVLHLPEECARLT